MRMCSYIYGPECMRATRALGTHLQSVCGHLADIFANCIDKYCNRSRSRCRWCPFPFPFRANKTFACINLKLFIGRNVCILRMRVSCSCISHCLPFAIMLPSQLCANVCQYGLIAPGGKCPIGQEIGTS